jgi:hypothetical protein
MARGWDIFPVRDKRPLIKWKEGACRTWEAWPEDADVGLPTGARNGLVVVDDDRGKKGMEPWVPATPTYNVRTRGGGVHWYYAHPGYHIPNSAGRLADHVDVRGDGGYVVVYELSDLPLAVLPDGLIPKGGAKPKPTWIDPYQRQLMEHMLLKMPPWPQGERNFTLFKMACVWQENNMDLTVLYQKALQSGVHPEEAERTLASARTRVLQ